MTAKHGLNENILGQITAALAQFPQVERAVLFGSRAKGTYRPGSDIDLALVGDHLNWQILGSIEFAFDDLSLPHRFSLIMLNDRTDPDVAAHVGRVGIPLYARELAPASSGACASPSELSMSANESERSFSDRGNN
jgi:predicted nucleotidyltransferase